MRITCFVLSIATVVLIAIPALAGPTLVERSFLGGMLTLLVPDSFTEMEEEMLRIKYPSERRPTTVLTNPEGSVNVAVNHTQNALQPTQIADAHAAMVQTLRSAYPSAKWNRSEVVSVRGQKFFVLDLQTPAMDTEIRNIIAGTSLDGRLLLITFNCTQELEHQWSEVGRRIVESVSLPR